MQDNIEMNDDINYKINEEELIGRFNTLKLHNLLEELNDDETVLTLKYVGKSLEFVNNSCDDTERNDVVTAVMSCFINNLAKKRITDIDTISNIAEIISEMNDVNYEKWFA